MSTAQTSTTQPKVTTEADAQTFFKKYIVPILEKPEKVFVILSLIFGVAMIIAMPLFMVPDEGVHFDRAYQVGEGHLTSQTVRGITGGRVPNFPGSSVVNGVGIPPIPRSHYFTTIPKSQTKFIPFPSSALYSPAGYMPQAVGIDIGKIVRHSAGTMILGGRLCNLIAYVFLVWLAIRIARHGKWVYAVIGLFPVAIQEAASLSTDVMTIGLAFITIALTHNLFTQKKLISRNQCIALIGLAIGLGLTKQTNIVLLSPLIFLPKRIFPKPSYKLLIVAGALGASLLAVFTWYATIKLNHYELDYSATLSIDKVDQTAQIKHAITHPLDFIKTLAKTYVFAGFKGIPLPDFFWVSMYGDFSLLVYTLPIPFIFLGYLALTLAYFYSGSIIREEKSIVARLAWTQTTTFIISIIVIAAALYAVWTPVGAQQVAGLQGRYFIPILPLLIPFFIVLSRWVKVTLDKPYRMGMIVSAVASVNLLAMLVLTLKYYW